MYIVIAREEDKEEEEEEGMLLLFCSLMNSCDSYSFGVYSRFRSSNAEFPF